LQLYDRLYDLRSEFQREPDASDLYVADGLFTWNFDGRTVRHPVLLQRAEILFDAETATLAVGVGTSDPELFNTVMSGADEGAVKAFAISREELDNHDDIWPLAGEQTTAFLKRLANSVAKGSFSEDTSAAAGDRPTVSRMAMLLVMPRGLGMADFIDRAISDLETGGDPSPCIKPIMGLFPDVESDSDNESSAESVKPDEDPTVFFTKPANDEQLKIVRQYRNGGRVVVQGPPGTGKSHTIANLIGHFLAEGKNVLVTADTTKALKVLRDKVEKGLQPLCISVTDSDIEGRELLKAGVAEMHRVKKDTDPVELKRQSARLEAERIRLIQRLKQCRRELFIARQGEVIDIRACGRSFKPSEAGSHVREYEFRDNWIPGSIQADSVQPITEEELSELYASNVTLSPADESNDTGDLLAIDQVPDPESIALILNELSELSKDDVKRHEIDRSHQLSAPSSSLTGLLSAVSQAISTIGDKSEPWRHTLIDEGRRGFGDSSNWPRILNEAVELLQRRQSAVVEIHRHGVTIGVEEAPGRTLDSLHGILAYLQSGKQISIATKLTKPAWKKVLEEPYVNGRGLRTVPEALAVIQAIELQGLEQEFERVWRGIAVPVGLPTADASQLPCFEIAVRLRAPILQCLSWFTTVWEPLCREIESAGFSVAKTSALVPSAEATAGFASEARWMATEVFVPAISAAVKLAHIQNLQTSLSSSDQQLREGMAQCQSPLLRRLATSLKERDIEAYCVAHEEYSLLLDRSTTIRRRNQLLERVRPLAKGWSSAIALREGVHGCGKPPGTLKDAWTWKLLDMELTRRHALSVTNISRQISEISSELAFTTTELTKVLAWGHLHQRIKPPIQAALERYRQAASIVTGKKKAVMAREAKEAMAECATAVPVWIMPISRVATSFDPGRTRFDVVIMDEASQVGVTGLAVLHMARTAIIVGDDEQTEPLQPGIETDKVLGLSGAYLSSIQGGRQWNERMSVYRLALGPYSGGICLLEHFRCVPEIISFSSILSYGGEIKPLRDDSSVMTKPHVVHVQVPQNLESTPHQQHEAEFIVSLLKAASEQPEYAKSRFGVVAMRGTGSGDYGTTLRKLAARLLGMEWCENHEFLCGTPPQFQGDEREVVILAMGDHMPPAGTQLHLQRAAANENLWKKRYNVAASRAQDQLWVVSSFGKEHVQTEDIRYTLLDFAQNPQAWRRRTTEENPQAESEFERLVYRDLAVQGYKLTAQYPVGRRRIDIVAESNGKRCAIECDGEKFHGPDQLENDIARQSDLERAGKWKFVRIRGSKYFRDPIGAIQEACVEMARIGVVPSNDSDSAPPTSDLMERILILAQEARFTWQAARESEMEADE
jgi:very-short-patch-repair endonuclease